MYYFTLISILICSFLSSCSSSKSVNNPDPSNYDNIEVIGDAFAINSISLDKTYGYSEGNPIKVSGGLTDGALNERRFLNALRGPNGEAISYHRRGSCCPFKSRNSALGLGMLDIYEITWENQETPTVLYLNMYDKGNLVAPFGLTFKK